MASVDGSAFRPFPAVQDRRQNHRKSHSLSRLILPLDGFETAPGANAFFQRFVGTVTDQETGQRYHLAGAVQTIIFQDGTVKTLPVPFLSLTPIGG